MQEAWINTLFGNFIKKSDVKICFEEKGKLALHASKIINISIHPIRFADDIFLNFETNDEQIRKILKKYEVNYDIFYTYADIAKTTYIKNMKKEKYEKDSLLIVGQTESDKVLFDGEKYLALVDYVDDIKTLSASFENIYFKPHPYAKNTKKLFKELRKRIPNIKITYDNIYFLLSSDNIKSVVGINSSVLYEAKYFGKKVTFLYKQYFDFVNSDIGIYGDYFNSSFWTEVAKVEDLGFALPFVPNRLRKAINDFWGYSTISDEIVLKDIIKSKVKYFLSKYTR